MTTIDTLSSNLTLAPAPSNFVELNDGLSFNRSLTSPTPRHPYLGNTSTDSFLLSLGEGKKEEATFNEFLQDAGLEDSELRPKRHASHKKGGGTQT